MDADDEAAGHEAVHLGHARAVSSHAEGDDVNEVGVVVDDIVVGSRIVDIEIKPEKRTAGHGLLDGPAGSRRGPRRLA